MTPLTRKENYLNEIVGWGETAPEKPLTPEEFFFAAILGEAVQTPEPLNRYQIYLAKIAGRNISVPKPLTRLELFLAKACGMDIETPTPITREEIFWSNYTAIVEFEVEGVPPLTYKAIEGTLENYRIYGNTVNGENVGDLITEGEHAGEYNVPVTVEGKNLFSSRIEQGSFDGITGVPNNLSIRVRSHEDDYIFLTPGVYKISAMGVEHYIIRAYDLPDISAFNYNLSMPNWAPLSSTITINTSAYYKFAFCKTNNPNITPSDVSNIMLNTGSTALPYEPYHTPVTTPIYLPEPIKMVGDEAEYVDFEEQKQHRVRKNLLRNTATSQTINGVTFTVNNDGSVTCNGTATALIVFKVNGILTLPVGEFILTGSPTGGSWHSSYYLYVQTDNISPQKFYNDIGNGVTINNTSADIVYSARIVIESGYSINNQTFYPMIRKAGIVDDTYEPYIENTELDVALPEIPTLSGTNTLTVGTEVQPSKVYVKYKGERQ